MFAGHAQIVATIEEHGLPPVALFLGPQGVGKRRLANQLARDLADDERDVLRINRLTADLARAVDQFVHTAPSGTRQRVVIANIDGAPQANLNTLLKSLEDVPVLMSRVILLASSPPLETVVSRAEQVYHFSLLTDEEVEQAMIMRGLGKSEAGLRSHEGGGQMLHLHDREEMAKQKSLVLVVARCFREHDHSSLEALGSRWTDDHTALLIKLAHEAATKRWRVFNEAEVGTIPGRVWLAILRAVRTEVRPRLVIHAQLAGVLRSIS